ncbi:hypothetical protein Fmac_018679 [Flemingia macrophylla]|uniref:Ycf15 n=1 Tax=Flemingia macrophylla TaxID=520843 RepID=A0ABD1M6B9_9FABA
MLNWCCIERNYRDRESKFSSANQHGGTLNFFFSVSSSAILEWRRQGSCPS